MSKSTASILIASIACLGIGIVFGSTIQERHDAKGLRELQRRMEDLVYDVQNKRYVEVTGEETR